jgi:hypothetical protein
MALVHIFAACDIGGIFLSAEERGKKKADEPQDQSGCHTPGENTHHAS